MIPDEIKIFLLMVANMTQGARVEYFHDEARRLLAKYNQTPHVGPSEFKAEATTITPTMRWD